MSGTKIRLASLVVLGLSLPVCSFAWNPTLSVLGTNTITGNYDVPRSGIFDVQNRKVNFGFEFMNKFRVHDRFFFRTGLRYATYSTSISAQNPVPFDASYRLSWQTGYTGFTVPLQFGKDFTTAGGHKGDCYSGVSAGIIMPSSETDGVSIGGSGNTANTNPITTRMPDPGTRPSSLIATADFGINYQPVATVPRFTVGFLCSIQLNKTKAYDYTATVDNGPGNYYIYDLQQRQQFTNCSVSLSYTFGRFKESGGAMLPLTN